MQQAIILSLLLLHCVVCEERLAPWFAVEPPARVQYLSRAGARVTCAARGSPPPAVTWLHADNTPLGGTPHIRHVYNNGTLEVLPSTGGGVEVTVRCRAENAHGVALSRDVVLQPVEEASWEPEVSAAAAAEGGVAALVCHTGSGSSARFVRVELWYRGDTLLHIPPPSPESRYVSAGEVLLVREVRAADAGRYSCVARHDLTAAAKRAPPATLTVTPGSVNSAPRLLSTAGEISVQAGTDFCLPCVSSEHPQPHYTWYREWNGRLESVEGTDGVWLWGEGAALCVKRARRELSGAWLCKAYNVFGDATAQLRLIITDTLSVTVTPTVVVADAGSDVRLNCSASDPRASLSWVHDAAAAGAGPDLHLRGITRTHRGLYQCFARRNTDTAQASAEIRLGDSPPELHYTFIEQALRPGGGVSLRCAASGSPAPRLAWLLDSQPLEQFRAPHRYIIGEETSLSGDVVSVLNMSAVTTADGGRYTCRAHNRLGYSEHSARLNIYGPPSIRALGPVRVVAGANATVFCPYAGYPISSISWWRRGAGSALAGAGRVAARGAELRLAPALPADAGLYACVVAAPQGPTARRDIEVQVRNPPKISPFMFSSELTEGSSVQILCGVSSGDKPMYFSWLKDGAPLPSDLQIEEKSLNEFSLLMFSDLTARHSGEYTCRVSNHAATVNYTATLSVKVAPVWITEPQDSAVLLGTPILIECAAKGYPTPSTTWERKIVTGEVRGEGADSDQWERVLGGWGGAGQEGEVRMRDGALVAPSAARTHQGVYRCGADNGVGVPLLKHINLTVHEPAHFDEKSSNVTCVRGHSTSLTCHALGDAPLVVHWTHRGNRIDLNSYRWTISEVRTGEGLRSTLQLRTAERNDAGEYKCHAHNQYGRSELSIQLHVEEPPEPPRGLRLAGVGARWVRVQWMAPHAARRLLYTARLTPLHAPSAAPLLAHNITLDAERAEGEEPQSLIAQVKSLHPAAAYSLRLAAANHVGRSPQSDPLMFTTLEEVPTAAPQNVRVRPANAGELHITWLAPPQHEWNGELLGYVATWREVARVEDGTGAEDAGRLTSPGWSSAEATVVGLHPSTRYAVTLRAYNKAGAGPSSPIVYATTADGVPEDSPKSVSCEVLSSRSLRVRWLHASRATAPAQPLRGYDIHYAPLELSTSIWKGGGEAARVRASTGGEATLQGLRAATNYSVWVRARSDAGLGPPAHPVYCYTHEDVPGPVETIRALAAGEDAVRVTWLAPVPPNGRLTHYTLYTRELGKAEGEWSQRVEAGEEEVWREVRGLRAAVYEVWVRAATAAGSGPPSRPVTAAPAPPLSARISSFGRIVSAAWGSRIRLKCAAVGSPPLRWRWSPLPQMHTITETGDLIVHKIDGPLAGNYTCSVRNTGGSDAAVFTLTVRMPPPAPVPRLLRADSHALHLGWDLPPDSSVPVLGYTVTWLRNDDLPSSPGSKKGDMVRLPAVDTTTTLRRLACGAAYRVTVSADNAVGTSPPSRPLVIRTKGDKAKPAPGKEFVWANSTTLRLNLLAWRARCAVHTWRLALRHAPPAWTDLHTDGETAQAINLQPGTWYEIRVVAISPAGETVALYRAATHTVTGERLGEAVEVPLEVRSSADAPGASGAGAGGWRAAAGLAPAVLGTLFALLLVAIVGFLAVKRRATCLTRECSLPRVSLPHPQLYSTEPGKKNGKMPLPVDGEIETRNCAPVRSKNGSLHEISPYATFSMAGGERSCALHLHTFARAELDLAAPPPRPNLLAHHTEYGRCRDSDSSSSGSTCAACAADVYRARHHDSSDTESSARPPRRHQHADRPSSVRYFAAADLRLAPDHR